MLFLSIIFSISVPTFAQNWDKHDVVPADGRENIFQLSPADWAQYVNAGKLHAQEYPVTVTGVLPAYIPLKNLVEDNTQNPFRELLNKLFQNFSGFHDFDEVMKALGLHRYPNHSDTGVYAVPYPKGIRPTYRMGFGTIERKGATGFTFSCAACHSSNLFGKTVLGLTNRFPRANDFFFKVKKVTSMFDPHVFQAWTKSTREEAEITDEAAKNLRRVSVTEPLVIGLDTSLAQVAESLNRRTDDSWATPSFYYQAHQRPDPFFKSLPADSKPAVWWNLKYKNRWLSDGSVVSGNPIFTNIIWNEIGRGADLRELQSWMQQNIKTINEMTAAVFASQAPRITDFFPAEKIDLASAQRGEVLFNDKCSRCHGQYEKAWSQPEFASLTPSERLRTTRVIPKKFTPVEDVGTDPLRYQGMSSLEKLNRLEVSKVFNVVIEKQQGYVPPPLVGIWARWPYMHNNSMPTLCEVLLPAKERAKTYYAGEALNKERDFDIECNGYPTGTSTPAAWKSKKWLYDSSRVGLGNSGHDEDIFVENGINQLRRQDRKDLIHFLQTL